ncbi:MAG: DUF4276 family protein [Byssovorax sp.]
MVAVVLFVEGGGDRSDLQSRCREGFRKLLEPIMLKRGQLKIVACGSRDEAYKSFSLASENPTAGTSYLLLVDAEEPVASDHGPWQHLSRRDPRWKCPAGVDDDSVHFMAVMTETWLVADPAALASYYGEPFKKNALPRADNLEEVSKEDVVDALKSATKPTKKQKYEKSHGWELVGKISPDAIRKRCKRFGKRFLDHMAKLART